jgi:hypothetical protein
MSMWKISSAIPELRSAAPERTIIFQGVVDHWLDRELTVGLLAAGVERRS